MTKKKRSKKRRKILYWIGGVFLLIAVGIGYVLNQMNDMSDKKVLEKLTQNGIIIDFQQIVGDSGSVNVARSGNPQGQKLMLIHGSPGDWSAWSNVFLNAEIQAAFDILAIDRPGYGKTTIPAQGPLDRQASAVVQVTDYLWPDENFIVVGHSYGGAVVEQLVLDQKERVEGAVFVAATLSPEHQAPKWYNKLAKLGAINTILPDKMKSSNIEMMALGKELKENESRLSSIDQRVVLIQGKKDVLVPFETVDYIKAHTSDFEYVLNDTMNHFVPWSHPQLITDAILSFKSQ